MPEVTFGLSKLLTGVPAGDGGMSTVLAEQFGYTVPDSFSITTEDGTVTELFVEEFDTAVVSQNTAGAKRVTWESRNVAPESLLAAFGGTVTGTGATKKWNSPANIQALILSVRAETKNNQYYAMAKVSVMPALNIAINKTDTARIRFVGSILVPDKSGVSPIERGYLS